MVTLDSHIASSVSRIAIAIVAIFGNLLILVVVAKNKNLRRSGANVLLAQLAFADLIIGIGTGTRGASAIYLEAQNLTSYERLPCIAFGFPTILGIHLSQTTMVAIAVDRLFCIRYPVLYRRTESNIFGITRFAVCSLFSLIGSSLPFLGVLNPQPVFVCSIGLAALSWFTSYWLAFASVLTIVLYVVYIVIYFVFARTSSSVNKTAAQRTITVTITAILVSYFILYCIPNILILLANLFWLTNQTISITSYIMGIGSGLNAAGNVFIYGWKHTELRAALKRVPLVKHVIFCNEKTITVTTATPMSVARSNSKMYG